MLRHKFSSFCIHTLAADSNISSYHTIRFPSLAYMTLPKAGMSVCANQKEKTSLGPVMRSLGTRPLNSAVGPSVAIMRPNTVKPEVLVSKFAACAGGVSHVKA